MKESLFSSSVLPTLACLYLGLTTLSAAQGTVEQSRFLVDSEKSPQVEECWLRGLVYYTVYFEIGSLVGPGWPQT